MLEITREIANIVTENAGQAFLVGGAVRDELLGFPSKDEDVLVTGVAWSVLEKALASVGRVDAVGASFGVLKVARDGLVIDVALPRTERSTGIGHRDFTVSYDPNLPLEADLARRDFTVNAMAKRISDGVLIDPFNGLHDLEHRVLRAVGNPRERFIEDPLRMLRAARFVAKLNFVLEPETLTAVKLEADRIKSISPERIQNELWGMLAAPHAAGVLRGLAMLRDTGLLAKIIPELEPSFGFDQQNPHHHLPLDGHVFEAIRYAVAHNTPTITRLALLLHDVSKPETQSFDETGIAHYYRHEDVGATKAKTILERLKFSSDVIESVTKIVFEHMRPPRKPSTKSLRRWLNTLGSDWQAALACREADLAAHVLETGFEPRAWAQSIFEQCQNIPQEVVTFDERNLKITGTKLMREFNLSPGPALGELKKCAARAVIDGELENEESAILEWLEMQVKGQR
jgi:tRNA nucleotidyltransferase (CCA-adding enzyme)